MWLRICKQTSEGASRLTLTVTARWNNHGDVFPHAEITYWISVTDILRHLRYRGTFAQTTKISTDPNQQTDKHDAISWVHHNTFDQILNESSGSWAIYPMLSNRQCSSRWHEDFVASHKPPQGLAKTCSMLSWSRCHPMCSGSHCIVTGSEGVGGGFPKDRQKGKALRWRAAASLNIVGTTETHVRLLWGSQVQYTAGVRAT
jgi:hypothetical protein